MKELLNHVDIRPNFHYEVRAEAEYDKQVFEYSELPHPGHKLFKLNLITGKISLAEIESTLSLEKKKVRPIQYGRASIPKNPDKGVTNRVKVEPDHWYRFAMNAKNAKKKFVRSLAFVYGQMGVL